MGFLVKLNATSADDGTNEDDDCSDGDDYDNDTYVPPSRPKRRAGRGKKDESTSFEDNPEANCLGCGCLVLFVTGIFIALRMCS